METAIRQAFPEAQKTAQVAPPPAAPPGHRSAARAPDAYGRSAAQERHRLRSGGRLLSWDGPPGREGSRLHGAPGLPILAHEARVRGLRSAGRRLLALRREVRENGHVLAAEARERR